MKIIIEGDPIPKKRHRCRCVHGHGQAYDEQAKNDMPIVRSIMHSKIGNLGIPFDSNEVLMVSFTFYLPINESDSTSIRNGKLWGLIEPNKKPDFDNLIKFYCDCANGVLWRDDCMITQATCRKIYSENPRTEIEVIEKKSNDVSDLAYELLELVSPDELFDLLVSLWQLSNIYKSTENNFDLKKPETLHGNNGLTQVILSLSNIAVAYADLFKKMKKTREKYGYKDGEYSIESFPCFDGKPSLP